MRRRMFLLVLLFVLGWLAEILSRRPPDWIRDDPIVHPFGLDASAEEEENEAAGAPGPPLVTADQPLDINHADAAALTALPGVGPVLAARIVALRDSVGGFHRKEELLAVKGVGPRTLQRLTPLIRLH